MRIVRIFNSHPRYRRRHHETIRLVRTVLSGEKRLNAEINVIFNDDKQMVKLNSMYLNHHYATDVISFPLADQGTTAVAGEVYINIDQANRQAREYRVALSNELARLTIHGVLHLLGYDDRSKTQKEKMTLLENRYLKFL
jgi:probable rRNA maturation factor